MEVGGTQFLKKHTLKCTKTTQDLRVVFQEKL